MLSASPQLWAARRTGPMLTVAYLLPVTCWDLTHLFVLAEIGEPRRNRRPVSTTRITPGQRDSGVGCDAPLGMQHRAVLRLPIVTPKNLVRLTLPSG